MRRFIRSVRTSTSVLHVDTDAGEGYMKVLGNPEGPHALACELVGTQLAQWLGLPTLEYAVIVVSPDDELTLAGGGMALPGPAFITRAEPGFPWGGGADALLSIECRRDISGLVVLDTWIRNCDRYRPGPDQRVNYDNVFLAQVRNPGAKSRLTLKVVDFTHAFTCGRDLTAALSRIDCIRDTMIYGCFPEFRPLLNRGDVDAFSSRLCLLERRQVHDFIAAVPAEWQVPNPVRDAWAAFIIERAAFVADNIASWLWP